ncbi:glyoxalase superfamily protein [Boseaceae bacterium BT-24-1]|nr:glyoxalase superfamily protein [Boseaceae bacterium BT-24-1]
MRSFMDAKAMAKSLRQALAERKVEVSHSDCLELVSRQFGLANWNTLSALIDDAADQRALPMPQGWMVSGSHEKNQYRLGIDPDLPGVALIESRFSRASGIDLLSGQFATLMQSVVADAYRGSRLRLAASLKTEDADAGTIWLRIDDASGKVLRFDNMMQRQTEGALRGRADWIQRSIVLDIPEAAASINYGFFLQGYGRCWARAFELTSVDDKVAPTHVHGRHLPQPQNLDFVERVRTNA